MKSKIKILIMIFVIGLLSACGESPEDRAEKHTDEHTENNSTISLTPKQVAMMQIQTGVPEKRVLTDYLSAPAKIVAVPSRIASIGTLISGRATHIYVHEGDAVQKGDVLLEIQGLEIGEIKGEFIRTQAGLRFAEAHLQRQKKLRQENIAAEKAYIEANFNFQKAQAAFSAADQKLHSIGVSDAAAENLIKLAMDSQNHQVKLQTTTLKINAPISGIISVFHVKLGQLIEPSSEIMEVLDSDAVWAVADIYEKDLKALQPNQRIEITTAAWPGETFSGKLEFISAVVDPHSRTVKVRSTLANPEHKLKPDMFANMRIFSDSLEAKVVVPQAAVQRDDHSEFVFIRVHHDQHDGEAEHEEVIYQKIPIKTGIVQDSLVEITAGLAENVEIVTQGAFFLKSEMLKGSVGGHSH